MGELEGRGNGYKFSVLVFPLICCSFGFEYLEIKVIKKRKFVREMEGRKSKDLF